MDSHGGGQAGDGFGSLSAGGQPAESLGSLGQNARAKHLRSARWIFVVVGVLTIGGNAFVYTQVPKLIDQSIAKEKSDGAARGMIFDEVKIKELRDAAVRSGQLVSLGFIAVGVVYLLFAVFVEKYPVPITLCGLILYLAGWAVNAAFDPRSIAQGIILKVIIIVALVKAVQAAIAYERERKAIEGGELLA